MNKKVLLIEISPDFEMGGTQKYNHQLINIINNNFNNVQIDQVCFFRPKSAKTDENKLNNYYYINSWKFSKVDTEYNFLEWGINILKMRKKVYELNKLNHYDLIIDSTFTTFKKFFQKNNYWWIQHTTVNFYNSNIYNGFKKNIVQIGKKIFGVRNNLFLAKNLILFSKQDYDYVVDHRKDDFNAVCINPSCKMNENFNISDKSYIQRKRIIYFGRIDNTTKNVLAINEINKQINLIDFYGKGNQEIIKKLGNSYKGYLEPTVNSFYLLKKYKYIILMSNYEGFPFSLVESLAAGVPIIVKNSFLDAKYLVNNNENGFLLKNNQSIDEYAKQINEIYNLDDDKYYQLCVNAYNFAFKNLNEKTFNEKWLAIFNEYLK